MNEQLTVFGETNAEYLHRTSIQLIKEFAPIAVQRHPLGYVVGYSGGKDSDVLLELFREAGVKYCVIHNHTTLDAPETVYYIRKKFAKLENKGIPCKINYPRMSFWQLCFKKRRLPTRICRFCCSELKERTIGDFKGAIHSFGVRKAESVRRAKNRDSIEMRNNKSKYSENFHFDNSDEVKSTDACYTKKYFIVNPLAYWTDDVLWDYINSKKLELNPLYARGWQRVGCIGCPMAAGKYRNEKFKEYPAYEKRFIWLCNKIITQRNNEKLPNKYNFKTGQEYFDWWIVF
ncbi:MAG TPA: phosphoadenosine phosphosulfate reductase family protein [Clostridia bacterium]|nr:phosphoadenosine phosphosulfate reductase family protein [Clostridia bacterium]